MGIIIDSLAFTKLNITTICLLVAELIIGALIIILPLILLWRHYKTFVIPFRREYNQRQCPANEINEDLILRIKLQYFEVLILIVFIILIILAYLIYQLIVHL